MPSRSLTIVKKPNLFKGEHEKEETQGAITLFLSEEDYNEFSTSVNEAADQLIEKIGKTTKKKEDKKEEKKDAEQKSKWGF